MKKPTKKIQRGPGRPYTGGRVAVTTLVSFARPEDKERAVARASELGMNMSEYINRLIQRDVGYGGPFVIEPKKQAE